MFSLSLKGSEGRRNEQSSLQSDTCNAHTRLATSVNSRGTSGLLGLRPQPWSLCRVCPPVQGTGVF